jgi:hypothetical protein
MKQHPTPERGAAPLRRREWLAAMAALAAQLAGCGGGVDSGGTGTGAAPTLAVGTISGFGSIIVNGARYDESAAQITADDGRALTRDDLRLGMRVSVLAALPDGGVAVASAVTVQSELAGPIEALDLAAGRLTVLSQRVDLNAATVVEGGTAALAAGVDVRVYATLDVALQRYVATRVEPRTGAAFDRLRGVVGTLDSAGRTLTIGALRIDWSGAAPADPASALAPGRRLSVKLSRSPASGTRVATEIESEPAELEDRDNAELQGRVTALTSARAFELDGVPVDAAAASFPGGEAGVVLGAKVEVEGRISGGVLVAAKVSVETEEEGSEPYELNGEIASLDVDARSFVVHGVTVRWSTDTRFSDGTAADLAVGAQVEVKGALSGDGQQVEASSIQFDD